jgi:uncharacterized protein YPO0396
MAEEFTQIKIDIGELKTNVNVIKSEVTDMRHSVTNAIDKIANSMATLATVTEKLHHNDENHKDMYDRLDTLDEKAETNHTLIIELGASHKQCLDTRRAAEEAVKNSPWQKAKDKAVEYLFVIIIVLVVYVLGSHFTDFTNYMNSQSNANPVVKVP